MLTIQFDIPDAVATFIQNDLKVAPKTYIQNHFINPIIEKYQASTKAKRVAEAEAQADLEIAQAKTAMKITLTNKVK